jgi:hypothetical protein
LNVSLAALDVKKETEQGRSLFFGRSPGRESEGGLFRESFGRKTGVWQSGTSEDCRGNALFVFADKEETKAASVAIELIKSTSTFMMMSWNLRNMPQ